MSDAPYSLLPALLEPEIHSWIEARQWKRVREALRRWPAPEVAELLVLLPPSDRVLLFGALRPERAAAAFTCLAAEAQIGLLDLLAEENTRHLLEHLSPDDRTRLLEGLSGEVRQGLLNLLSPEDLEEARELLGYPDGSVGRRMTPHYVAIRPSWKVSKALEHLRKMGRTAETLYRLYVVDEDWRLLDDLELRTLILADPDALVVDLMERRFISLQATASTQEALLLFRRYDGVALPVLGPDGVLLGILTVDDILREQERSVTEDFHRGASIDPLQISVGQASIPYLYRRRIGWLLVLVLMNVFSGAGLAFFQETIEATVALVFFLPLLIGSAGNAGSQSATLMVRAMATGEVRARDWFRLLVRETGVSLLMGMTMALAVVLLAYWRGGFDLALVVGVSMAFVVILGSLVGMSLPFLLVRFRMDPATASAPLVTSVADVSGVVLYLSFAAWWIGS
jgi:magnesium transporter